MEDRQIIAYITTIFFIAISAGPWAIIAYPTCKRIAKNGIWAAPLPLAITGLIVALASYAFLYATFMILAAMATYKTGAPASVIGAASTAAVSYKLVQVAVETAKTPGAAILFTPCLSGITGGIIAIATAAVMTLIQHIRSQTWAHDAQTSD